MSDVVNYMALAFGILLTLKKIADMERYYYLRLAVLTVALSLLAILFFLGYGLGLGSPGPTCMPLVDTQF